MPQETLATPQDPRPSRLRGLWNRIRGRRDPERLETEPDKMGDEDPPGINAAMDLENLAINSDEILQEDRNLDTTPPPIPEFVRGRYNYTVDAPPKNDNYVFVNNRDDFDKANWYKKGDPIDKAQIGQTTYDELEKNNLLNGGVWGDIHHNQQIATMNDDTLKQGLIDYGIPRNLSKKESMQQLVYKLEDPSGIEQSYAPARREYEQKMSSYLNRFKNAQNDLEANQIFMDMDKDQVLSQRLNPTPQERLKQAGLSRQNSPQQPYPENWNPQSNTKANRAWGAQNIANREAEIAQNEARVSGLGNVARKAQAAEALPGAASRVGNAAARAGVGLSNFAARALPIINLGLLGYSLYNQAKNNRENAQYRKMVEGNRI